MARTKISEFSATPANNTDIDSINISEGCAPSGINDAIRELMAQLKDWQSGTSNDPMVIGSSGSLTLNQGTANGVTYLNGSKVVTSGSALVFDGSNLGLGVTPSAWSAFKPYQVGWGALASTSASQNTLLSSNVYFDGTNFKYIGTGTASYLQQFDGSFIWKTAASGTAGNNITFTQAMTLTAAGRLGIGTTSPNEVLDVAGNINTSENIQLTSNRYIYSSNGGSLGSVRSGLLLEGSSQTVIFLTGGTERARIDSSGRLLVGTTTALDGGSVFKMGDSGTPLNAYRATSNAAYGVSTAYSDIGGATTLRAYFRADGGVANYSANNVNLSDVSLKKDIVLAGNYLAKICAIPIKNFRYKDQSESEDITLGVIAQDVLSIAPELVSQEGFGTTEEGKQNYLSIYQTDLQYALMKCIQEQQAIIESFKARLDAANL